MLTEGCDNAGMPQRLQKSPDLTLIAFAVFAGVFAVASAALEGDLALDHQGVIAARPDQHFASCKEARAAGRFNIMRHDPSYRARLDRDRDGVACELRW